MKVTASQPTATPKRTKPARCEARRRETRTRRPSGREKGRRDSQDASATRTTVPCDRLALDAEGERFAKTNRERAGQLEVGDRQDARFSSMALFRHQRRALPATRAASSALAPNWRSTRKVVSLGMLELHGTQQ